MSDQDSGVPLSVGSESVPPAPKRAVRLRAVAAIAVVVILVLILGAYVATDGFHLASRESTTVLVPAGTLDTLPGQQFDDLAIHLTTAGTVSGTFSNTLGITLYTMTPTELLSLSKTGLVSGYVWTSGRIANLTVTDLSLTFQAGEWDLVFLNGDGPSPNPLLYPNFNTTSVAFYTDLTLVTG